MSWGMSVAVPYPVLDRELVCLSTSEMRGLGAPRRRTKIKVAAILAETTLVVTPVNRSLVHLLQVRQVTRLSIDARAYHLDHSIRVDGGCTR